jgi:hypothetical protein
VRGWIDFAAVVVLAPGTAAAQFDDAAILAATARALPALVGAVLI